MPDSSMAAVVHYALEPGAVELRQAPRPRDLSGDEVMLANGVPRRSGRVEWRMCRAPVSAVDVLVWPVVHGKRKLGGCRTYQ